MKSLFMAAVFAGCLCATSVAWSQASAGFTFTPLPSNNPNTNLIQAGDGNYYGVDSGSDNEVIYRMTPAGAVTDIYSTVPANDNPNPWGIETLIVGPDGRLYGTSYGGGVNGTIFAIDLSGKLTILYSFPAYSGCSYNYNWLLVGGDGDLYGPYQSTIFKISSTGAYSTFYAFTEENESFLTCGTALMQASDGNFYGTIGYYAKVGSGSIYQITPGGGFNTIYTFPGGANPTALAEGADGDLYGSSAQVAFFKITTDGTFTALNPQTSLYPYPSSTLLATDGNFYGSTGNLFNGPGEVDQFQPDGTTTGIYSFEICSSYGGSPLISGMIQGSDGNLYGATVEGMDTCPSPATVFRLTPPKPLPAPVQVSVTPSFVSIGQKTTLKWSVPGAINANYPICFASGNGGWTGKTATSGGVTDSINVAGTYTFGLTCGGNESGVATLVVSKELVSTVSLTATPNPVLAGGPVVLTATAAPKSGSGPAATGTVNFYYLSDLLGSATINNGTATLSASSAGIAPGKYAITAKYTGDANYAPATSSPVTVTVSAGYSTSSTLAVTPNPVAQGSNATLTATVSDTKKDTIPGTVSFTSEGVVIGTATLSHNETTGANAATLTASTQSTPPGTYVVKAQYQGSGIYLPSTSSGVIVQVTTK